MDCEWTEWQNGTCSVTCGDGTLINTRTRRVEAEHGGEECSGSSNMTESCNITVCPGNMYFHKYNRPLMQMNVLNYEFQVICNNVLIKLDHVMYH